MGKVYAISDDLLRVMRREMRKHGVTLVRNKKTGAIFVRCLTSNPATEVTDRQTLCRTDFRERSQRASQWIKDNDTKACPPDGTPEYQKMVRAFKRQDKIKRLLNFVMSKMERITSSSHS